MIHRRILPMLLAVALSAATQAAAQSAMTCDHRATLHYCTRHGPELIAMLGADFYQGMCEEMGGRWGGEPCPTENAVGTCDDNAGSVMTFYGGDGTGHGASTARETCAAVGGTFTEVPRPPPSETTTESKPPPSDPEPTKPDPAAAATDMCLRYQECCVAWADSMTVIDGFPQSSVDAMREACDAIRDLVGLPGAEGSCEIALDAMRQGAEGMASYPGWKMPEECL